MVLANLKKGVLALALGLVLSAASWFAPAHADTDGLIVVCMFDESGDLRVAFAQKSGDYRLRTPIARGDDCADAAAIASNSLDMLFISITLAVS
jgi:hypothetical protein